ncbi:HNH endonuclease [Leptospira bandrabouensis]|uniref:HNH endonuclease n=1 Tax=Leptospira bandrabouensis TaxID=2484903 RepID=UPI00223E2D23|nr:HNH endonuclease [Leptospira bandrabouensis]MCW7460428.1 HNH endonuclease [Leptospira bandrabouensis]MCW7479371.1 HNH endonuclease [Leptospira bandrabouensis]MCW7487049.1 HNH endonuclease [Leptospira bandrabouensis]
MKNKCFLCPPEFNNLEFDLEHIIPNSIGGRLKSDLIICKTCNNDFGHNLEISIAKQFDVICTTLNIKRERNEPPKIKLKTKEHADDFTIFPGGKTERSIKTRKIGNKEYLIYYSSLSELEKLKTQISKNREIVSEKEITEGIPGEVQKFHTLLFGFSTGNRTSYRAIAKMAAFYYLYCGGLPELIHPISGYIKGIYAANIVFPYSPESYINPPPNLENIQHTIFLTGDFETKLLWAYIELFNTFSYAIILNRNYIGPNIKSNYSINVMTGEQSTTFPPIEPKLPQKPLKNYIPDMQCRWKYLAKLVNQKLFFHNIGYKLGNDMYDYTKGTIIDEKIAEDLSNKLFSNEGSGFQSI